MSHTRAYRNHKTYIHIRRKNGILKNVYGMSNEEIASLENKRWQGHRLSKEKVHCSCPLCRRKTRYNGWKASDKRNIERMRIEEVNI